jgi:hypothetical protein
MYYFVKNTSGFIFATHLQSFEMPVKTRVVEFGTPIGIEGLNF